MKIALVHEYLTQYGGAERVLEAFMEIFPKAPVYTLVYDEKRMGEYFKNAEIRTSFIQKIPFGKSHYRYFSVLMPSAIEQLDLSYYDLVISDSSSFAKGVITKPHTKHICYCHTPTRFAWDDCQKYIEEFDYFPRILRKFAPLGVNYVRMWDVAAANRPDYFIANSNFVAERIKKYYSREAEVVYPPVNALDIQNKLKSFEKNNETEKKYFLILSRLLPNKRVELAIEAFNKLGLLLKVVGIGPLYKDLKKRAKSNIEFLGFVPDDKIASLYATAKAFIHPQVEDFGITALEAAAAGTPVIAFREGGALETVIEGKTGVFFNEQTPESLAEAVKGFLEMENQFNPEEIMEHARGFDRGVFKEKIREFIEKSI